MRYVVVTSGSKGSEDRTLTPEQLVEMRRAEQEEAARLLGVHSVGFLGFPDGELGTGRELLGAITREIRSFHPFAVYTHDPEPVILENSFVNHSDHRATGLATVDAVYPAARDHLNFPEQIAEGLETHKVRELYLFGTHAPNQDRRHHDGARHEDRGPRRAREPIHRRRRLPCPPARAVERGGRALRRALPAGAAVVLIR